MSTAIRPRAPFSAGLRALLLGAGIAGGFVACDDSKDETALGPVAGSAGLGDTQVVSASGAGGSPGGASGSNGGDGGANAGYGGLAPSIGTLVDGVCVGGTLESYCAGAYSSCRTLSALHEYLRDFPPNEIIEFPCHAADGSPRVLVYAGDVYAAELHRFDAAGTLVGRGRSAFEPGPYCDGSLAIFYGETGGDCTFSRHSAPPPGCPERDAGPRYECVLTDAGAGN